MPHEAKGFQCDFCTRMFGSLADAASHEDVCKFNPSRRTCYTCKNSEMMSHEVWREFTDDSGVHINGIYVHSYYGCKHYKMPITDDMDIILFDTDNDGINPALPKSGTCAFWRLCDAASYK